jgi:hypothetical protein
MGDDALKSTNIIIPHNIPVKVPKYQIAPAIGEFKMDCGRCGGREFGIHVKPTSGEFRGTAQIREVICTSCGNVFKTDPHGNLGGGPFAKRQGHEDIET